jgi:hypothetical protein
LETDRAYPAYSILDTGDFFYSPKNLFNNQRKALRFPSQQTIVDLYPIPGEGDLARIGAETANLINQDPFWFSEGP